MPNPNSFQLPDFLRIAWVSDQARDVWAERIKQIQNVWPQVALARVRDGRAGCSIRSVASWKVFHLQAAARRAQVPFSILGTRGVVIPGYGMTTPKPTPGVAYSYDVAFGKEAELEQARSYWDALDVPAAFKLAGHPDCCVEFAREHQAHRRIDPLWMIAGSDGPEDSRTRKIAKSGMPYPFWRWLQIEPTPQLPCSFDCPSMYSLSQSWIETALASGFEQEMEWLDELSGWPVEWSSLHGIAEIRTPIFKLCGTSDAVDCPHTLQFMGDRYPQESASGLRFPYKQGFGMRRTGKDI